VVSVLVVVVSGSFIVIVAVALLSMSTLCNSTVFVMDFTSVLKPLFSLQVIVGFATVLNAFVV
jgi:hypothetical protein